MPVTIARPASRLHYQPHPSVAQLQRLVAKRIGREASTIGQWFKSQDPSENRFAFIRIVAECASELGIADWVRQKLLEPIAICDGAQIIEIDRDALIKHARPDRLEDLGHDELILNLEDPQVRARYRGALAREILAKHDLYRTLCELDRIGIPRNERVK